MEPHLHVALDKVSFSYGHRYETYAWAPGKGPDVLNDYTVDCKSLDSRDLELRSLDPRSRAG